MLAVAKKQSKRKEKTLVILGDQCLFFVSFQLLETQIYSGITGCEDFCDKSLILRVITVLDECQLGAGANDQKQFKVTFKKKK